MNKPAGMKNHKLTRHYVPEPNGGEGDEAEVEGGKEAPVLPLDVNCKKSISQIIFLSGQYRFSGYQIVWLQCDQDKVVTLTNSHSNR